jgi:pyruvate ferredoxin oxidoreductase gamma subunit
VLHQVNVLGGLRPDGYLLVNTGRPAAELGIAGTGGARLCLVPATELAREYVGRPLPNAALLGAFAALTGLVGIDSVAEAIRGRFAGPVAERNIAAARAAFDLVRAGRPGRADQPEASHA